MTRFLLALVVRFLPDEQWRRAMLAEFAALESGRERRRFARGCARAVVFSGAFAGRLVGYTLIAATFALLVGSSGGNLGWPFAVGFAAAFLEGTGAIARKPAVVGVATLIGATAWWGAVLFLEPVRANPEWALLVIAACAAAAARFGGVYAAMGTAFATCLAIFVVAVGTYAVQPSLAPDIAPNNAADPLLENRIESTDPYVGELFLAGLIGLTLMGAAVIRTSRELPG